jgi:hypothetical protein
MPRSSRSGSLASEYRTHNPQRRKVLMGILSKEHLEQTQPASITARSECVEGQRLAELQSEHQEQEVSTRRADLELYESCLEQIE